LQSLSKVFRSALSQYSSAIMTGTTLGKEEAHVVFFLRRQDGSTDRSQYASDDSGGSAGASSIFRAHFFPPRCVYFTVAGVPEVIDAGWTGRPDSRIEVLSSKASITSSLSFTTVNVLEPGSTVWISPSMIFVSSTRPGVEVCCLDRRSVLESRSRYTTRLDKAKAMRMMLRIRANLLTTAPRLVCCFH